MSFEYKIYIDNSEVPVVLIKEYKLIADIDSIYSGGAVVISDDDGQFLDRTIFRIGADLTFVFNFDDNTSLKYRGVITEIEGEEDSSTQIETLGAVYIVYFAHYVLLAQDIQSRGFFDKTSNIISTEINKLAIYFPRIEIDESDDLRVRRYMLNQKPMQFIANIAKKTTVNGGPAVCYTDEYNNFYFKDLLSLFSKVPKISLVAPNSSAVVSYSAILFSAAYVKIFPNQSINTLKLNVKTFNIETFATEKKILSTPKSGRLSANINKFSNLTATGQMVESIYDSIQQKANIQNLLKNQLYNYSIEVQATESYKYLRVGDMVEFSPAAPALQGVNHTFSGNYLIKRIEHVLMESKLGTILTLIRPTLKANDRMTGALYDV